MGAGGRIRIGRYLFEVILAAAIFNVAVGFQQLRHSHADVKASRLHVATSPVLESPFLSEEVKPKVGVLLLNLGGPETSEDVEGTSWVNLSL